MPFERKILVKKVLSLFLLTLIFCSGCAQKSPKATLVAKGLSFNVEITESEENFKYSVIFSNKGEMKITDLNKKEPRVNYIFSEDTVTVCHNELTHKIQLENMNITSIKFLYEIFKYVNQNECTVKFKNDQYFVSEKTEDYDFTLYIGQSGLPIKLTEENYGFNINFSNVSLQ